MAEIHHRIGIKASAERIYQALTTNEGLASWWTNDVTGAGVLAQLYNFALTVVVLILKLLS